MNYFLRDETVVVVMVMVRKKWLLNYESTLDAPRRQSFTSSSSTSRCMDGRVPKHIQSMCGVKTVLTLSECKFSPPLLIYTLSGAPRGYCKIDKWWFLKRNRPPFILQITLACRSSYIRLPIRIVLGCSICPFYCCPVTLLMMMICLSHTSNCSNEASFS